MKFIHFSFCRQLFAVIGFSFAAVSTSFAVFPFAWNTDGSGNPSNGSWTGNGIVQPNLNSASTAVQIAVQGFSSGSFVINNMGGNLFSSGRLLTNPISATYTIGLTGGTADLRLHNSNNFDAGGSLFNSVGFTNFNGVTGIEITIRFSEPIAGRDTQIAELITRPMGAGLALINAGTGQSLSSYTVGMNYTEIYHELDGEFFAGVPSGAVPRQNSGFGTPVAGATSFTSDAFNALDEFLLVRGYDVDGGGYGETDAPLVYMQEMTWTITRDDNQAIANNTLFVTSMDGQQYVNVENVPEPTGSMLLLGSLSLLCLRRRRK